MSVVVDVGVVVVDIGGVGGVVVVMTYRARPKKGRASGMVHRLCVRPVRQHPTRSTSRLTLSYKLTGRKHGPHERCPTISLVAHVELFAIAHPSHPSLGLEPPAHVCACCGDGEIGGGTAKLVGPGSPEWVMGGGVMESVVVMVVVWSG